MSKQMTIIIQNAPYGADNKAWDALRFAGACLVQDMEVRVHLLDDGVVIGRRDQAVPEGKENLQQLLGKLMDCGVKVSACGKALDQCSIRPEDMLSGVERGSMSLLAGWVAESDLALTF